MSNKKCKLRGSKVRLKRWCSSCGVESGVSFDGSREVGNKKNRYICPDHQLIFVEKE